MTLKAIIKGFLKKSRLEFFLKVPRKYQIHVKGVHFHKTVWGSLVSFLGIFHGTNLIFLGIFLILLDVAGHIYTKDRPYLQFINFKRKKKNE